MIGTITTAALRDVAQGLMSGAAVGTLLRRADGKAVWRVPSAGGSLVVKVWSMPRVRALLLDLLGGGRPGREIACLRALNTARIPAPKLLASARLGREFGSATHAVAIEDLGAVPSAVKHWKILLDRGGDLHLRFEAAIVELTVRMLDCGIFDFDHSMMNIVPVGDVGAARIDLECGHLHPGRRRAVRLLGLMLGRLAGSFVFTAQPDMTATRRFADRLLAAVRPGAAAMAFAETELQAMLAGQCQRSGIETRFTLAGS